MQKWNLLKKTAPCILSLAVAATTFPTAVMASDLDAAVVSEAEAGDTEDFSTEETAEDTEAVAEEAIEDAADITEEAAEDAAVPEAAADETEDIQQEDTAEEADPFSTGEEDFTEGDEVAEAFSDSDQLTGEYQYVYAGLTWGEYWAAEGVYAAGDTSSSEEKDSHSEFDTGAFDTVTRATANHGLHRGSYQTEATIIAEDGTRFDVSYWEDKGSTLYLTDGSKVKWNRGSITTEDGKTYTMDHYEIYGLKYVPVAVKTADFADFCKKYNVVQDGAVLSGGYSENNLQYYKGLVADVNAQTNGLKYVEKNGDGFTFTARKSDGTASGIKDQALKTATEIKPSVKAASGSYGEFLRVDLNGNYGDLGANMQAVRWDYYGDDSTYTKCLASYGTKFAADNWMHKAMGIQLGLTKSARCKLPGGTDGTGYWKLTVYALGYNDYTYSFQATAENIVNPTMEPTDFTSLKTEVEAAKALAEALNEKGFDLVSGGTDNHLVLVKLLNKNITGKLAEKLLDDANITTNKNAIPNDPESPFVTSGLRLGTPAMTSRGFKEDDVKKTVEAIALVIDNPEDEAAMEKARAIVKELTDKYPLHKNFGKDL